MRKKRHEMIFLTTLKNKGKESFLSIRCGCVVASAENWKGNFKGAVMVI